MSRHLFFALASAVLAGDFLPADDPPKLNVSRTVALVETPAPPVKCEPGRFVPLELGSGKPALVEASDPDAVRIFSVKAGGTLIGVRYDEPAGAEPKEYSFPDAKGSVYVAIARAKVGPVKIRALVNGAGDGPPVVSGCVVVGIAGAPAPIPPPVVPPVVVTSFRVIFIGETGAGVSSIAAVRDYLNSKTTKEAGQPGWRSYPVNVDVTNEQPTMKALWAAVKPKVTTTPAVAIEVNGNAEIVPYPSAADALALLKKYGG